jgi:VWFA-related protein
MLLSVGACFDVARAQDAEETVRVRTRVVFLDALVRDKRTGGLASDLQKENFEVLADGKQRAVSYFSREGDAARRPLALVVVLDLNRIGAGRYLRRTEILEAMAGVLSKLPAQDEVALLALDVGGTGRREWLARFTRDRAQVASALSVVPLLVAEGSQGDAAPTDGDPSKNHGEARPPAEPQTERDEDNSRKKEGTGEVRTVNKDGTTTIKYVNEDGAMVTKTIQKDGKESVDIDYGFEFSAAVHEAVLQAAAERPNSQAAVVWLSDGITPVEYKDRDQATASLIQTNVIFSALTTDMKTGFKLFKPVLKPLGNWAGVSIYGTAQHVAKQTGGEAVRVNRPDDYASGLAKILGNLTGRYSLGFTLEENEQDDEQMHQLEVKVRAKDAKGKERKLEVVSRRGFFMPKENVAAQKGN